MSPSKRIINIYEINPTLLGNVFGKERSRARLESGTKSLVHSPSHLHAPR